MYEKHVDDPAMRNGIKSSKYKVGKSKCSNLLGAAKHLPLAHETMKRS